MASPVNDHLKPISGSPHLEEDGDLFEDILSNELYNEVHTSKYQPSLSLKLFHLIRRIKIMMYLIGLTGRYCLPTTYFPKEQRDIHRRHGCRVQYERFPSLCEKNSR